MIHIYRHSRKVASISQLSDGRLRFMSPGRGPNRDRVFADFESMRRFVDDLLSADPPSRIPVVSDDE